MIYYREMIASLRCFIVSVAMWLIDYKSHRSDSFSVFSCLVTRFNNSFSVFSQLFSSFSNLLNGRFSALVQKGSNFFDENYRSSQSTSKYSLVQSSNPSGLSYQHRRKSVKAFSLAFFLLLVTIYTQAATITSTSGGGNWNATT